MSECECDNCQPREDAPYPYVARTAAIREVGAELRAAQRRFPPMRSAHEGWAILREEVDELWDEVRAKQGARDPERLRREACQVAAMALRFMIDIAGREQT